MFYLFQPICGGIYSYRLIGSRSAYTVKEIVFDFTPNNACKENFDTNCDIQEHIYIWFVSLSHLISKLVDNFGTVFLGEIFAILAMQGVNKTIYARNWGGGGSCTSTVQYSICNN